MSGGGGKGAYEIGCWRAIRELGVPVHAVAGTSVGALNAALIAQGDVDRAAELWSRITAREVFAFTPRRLPALLLRLLLLPGLLYYRTSSKSRRAVDKLFLGAAVFTLLVVGVPTIVWSLASGYSSWATVREYLLFQGCIVLAIGVPVCGWFLLERHNYFVLDNRPLEETIQRFLDTAKVSGSPITTFVTASRAVDYFDPDQPSYQVDAVSPEIYYHPCLARAYLPSYTRLNAEPPDRIVQLLLASTSLPFGIFPNRVVNEAGWLDGGLADNTPVLPLINDGCDLIIVVHLDHRLSSREDLDAVVAARIADLERKLDIEHDSERNFQSFVARHGTRVSSSDWPDPVTQHPERDVPLPQLVHIVPSRGLGGLLRGTLRFSPRRATWLMRLGHADAMRALRTGEHRRRETARKFLRLAIGLPVAGAVLLAAALAVDVISRSQRIQEKTRIPLLFAIGVVAIVLGSGLLWLALLRRSLPESRRAQLIGAAVLTWVAGFLIAVHGMDGLTLGLIIWDVIISGVILAVAGVNVRSRVRSRAANRANGDADERAPGQERDGRGNTSRGRDLKEPERRPR